MTKSLFDPSQNAFQDVEAAIRQANIQNKNLLIELGGDWCEWCHRLEAFITRHPELLQLRSLHYVRVKIFVDFENWNASGFLQNLPSFTAIPHFFVYGPNGQFLHSQETEPLEEGDSYNYERVLTFLATWASAHTSGKTH